MKILKKGAEAMPVENDNEKVYETLDKAVTDVLWEVKEFGKYSPKHWDSMNNIFINSLAFEAFKNVSEAGDIYATNAWQQARKIKFLSTAYNNIITILKLCGSFEANLFEKRSTDKCDYGIILKRLKAISKKLDKTAKFLNDTIEAEMAAYVKFCTCPDEVNPYDDVE